MPQKSHRPDSDKYVLLTGKSNPKLAEDIASYLGKELFDPITIFSDGELRIRVPENVRRRHVYILQPTCPPVNDSIVELTLMIDAAKRSSADEITVFIPYFGYSRQDRKEMPRVPISASVIANIFENVGANRILTLDIHSEQAQGFVKIPWDNLYGSYSLVPEIKKRKLNNLIVASPDKGGVTRATGWAKLLEAEGIAIVFKERDVHINNASSALGMVGDVKGKNVLLVDDIIDTGGTIVNAANFLKQKGALKVIACTTHGVFSGEALQKIENSEMDEVITTDSIPQNHKSSKISVVSVAPLLGEAIKRIESGASLSHDLILS